MPVFEKGDPRINRLGRPKNSKNKRPRVTQETLDADMRQLGPAVIKKFRTLLNQSDLPTQHLIKLLCYISDYNKDTAAKEAAEVLEKKIKEKEKKMNAEKESSEESNVVVFSTKASNN